MNKNKATEIIEEIVESKPMAKNYQKLLLELYINRINDSVKMLSKYFNAEILDHNDTDYCIDNVKYDEESDEVLFYYKQREVKNI